MIIYQGTKCTFQDNVTDQTIADILYDSVYEKMHRKTGKSELRSWQNSMLFMSLALAAPSIPEDAGIAIEYNIPQTSKRVDFIVTGYDAEGKENAVIIELKQWDKITAIPGMDGLVETFTGGINQQVVHPSYQAWSYAALINDYNTSVREKEIVLSPCAYLHNYELREKNDPLFAPQYDIYLKDAPAFTKKGIKNLQEFICNSIKTGDKGKIRPSKSLQDAISSMVKGNREFIMIDDQKVVYETILQISEKCQKDGKKRTIIVEGGPGTGKTVVAINLLSKLTQEGQFAQYTSKNSAPRNVYKKKLKGAVRKSSVDNMFKGSGNYCDIEQSGVIDTILADEAHRLNEKSGLYSNMGENQIKEIIHAAKCSVFFIDESQRVTLKDIGSKAEIKQWAVKEKSEVYEMELVSQFRCNGSDGYLAWLDNTLEIKETANTTLEGIDYDIQFFDSPDEVRDRIFEKNKETNKCRIVAGYCWKWISNGKNNPDVHDIKIGDFEMSWNLGNTETWAIDEESVNEIGCIHTCQGLEFDYVGVIIGEDMIYRNGHIVTDVTKRASTDQSIKGIKKMLKEDPAYANRISDEIIKNTYRTLMTRGMKGCYVYCCDRQLQEYLKRSVI